MKNRKVRALSEQGEVLLFDSIKDALLFLGKSEDKTGIIECCSGRKKKAYGYKCEYVDEKYLE